MGYEGVVNAGGGEVDEGFSGSNKYFILFPSFSNRIGLEGIGRE